MSALSEKTHGMRNTSCLLIIQIAVAISLLAVSMQASGQTTGARPVVGLVLSGGAAHGIAHLGVLMVMEEEGLKPDCITGVSMGSIIGSLYSLGYSTDSIYSILKATDWNMNLSDKIPENKVVFVEKEHTDNSLVSLPVLLKKLRLPAGLIKGQQVENMLSYYLWPAADINDFSKLPLPFLCVGTDILTGKPVILNKGYLPDAIRASIAIPSIFTPLKIDTALLVDGGAVRNFAVSEAIDMGADIIIGSYTGFKILTEEQLESVPEIVRQLSFLRSYDDYGQQKKLVDILVEPEVKDLSIAGFSNVDTLVARGYRSAEPFRETFRRLADSLDRLGERREPPEILNKLYYSFDRIEIKGNSNISDQEILGVLDFGPGEYINKETLRDKIELLYGKALFEKVRYSVIPANDSLILRIDCTEKPPTTLYGALHYDNTLESGIILRLISKNLLVGGSLVNLDAYISEYYRFKASWMQFLNRSQNLGISVSFRSGKTMIPYMQVMDDEGNIQNLNSSSSIDFSRYIGLNHLMNLSFTWENKSFLPEIKRLRDLKRISFNSLVYAFNYQVNSVDTKHFPGRGTLFSLNASAGRLQTAVIRTDSAKMVYTGRNPGEFTFGTSWILNPRLKQYFSLEPGVTLSLEADLLLTSLTGKRESMRNYYFAGGIDAISERSIPMTGFHPNEVAVTDLASIGTGLDVRIGSNFHLNLEGKVAGATMPEHNNQLGFLAGAAAGAGYMSVIGPIRAGIMYGLSSYQQNFNRIKGYVSIGFSF